MVRTRTKVRIYTVVDVLCGVATGAENFVHIEDAKKCLKRLRRGRNLDEDDVQLFESIIDIGFPRLGAARTRRGATTTLPRGTGR